ncbi:MAG: glycosyltransferase family 4 protein [Thermoproteota archaeon]|jgi:glycosyltransferase involved in cell wall biosynthesis
MLKILIAPSNTLIDPDYGSEATWTYDIIKYVSEFHKIIAIAGRSTVKINNAIIIETGITKRDVFNILLFYFKIYQIGKKFIDKVDILHHMFLSYTRSQINPLAKHSKRFIIGPIQFSYTQLEESMINATIRKFSKIYGLMPTKHKINNIEKANTLIFDAYKTFNILKKNFSFIDFKNKIIKIIPPHIDTDLFDYAEPLKKDHYELLTVGRLIKRKGIDLIIRSLKILQKEGFNVVLKIRGEGPEKRNLEMLAKKLELNNVIFLERVSRKELANLYKSCDIYVHSSYAETIPTTIREAMSVGRPIVTTNVGVIDEYLKDGENGFLINKRDENEFAEAIAKLLSDENLRYKIGLNNRRYALEKFSFKNIIKQWLKVYEDTYEKFP